jgi:hypothetical protein
LRRFAEEEQRREDERDGRRLLSIACRPASVLLPHQQLVNVELEAPPPSPSVYMDMGSVSSGHYLRLQDQSEEEEEPVVFLDAVSTPSIPSVFYPCSIYNYRGSCCFSTIEVRFFRD